MLGEPVQNVHVERQKRTAQDFEGGETMLGCCNVGKLGGGVGFELDGKQRSLIKNSENKKA